MTPRRWGGLPQWHMPPAHRSPSRRLLLLILLPLLLVAGCSQPAKTANPGYVYSSGGGVTEWQDGAGPHLVELAGTDTAGQEVSTADWAGDVIVLNFWYAACPPCRAEAPILAALAAEFPNAHFLGINSVDTAETAAAFERTFELGYPSLIDSDNSVTAALQGVVPLSAFPTTLVVGTDGTITARIIGELDESTLRTLLQAAGA